MMYLQNISTSVQEGNARKTEELVAQALKAACPPAEVLMKGLADGMIETEKRFYRNEILDSDVLIAEWAMKAGLQILMPALKEEQRSLPGTVIIGTLEGELRETGKEILSCLMQSQGLRVIDLGTSVSTIRFVEAAIDETAEIIACTTALTIFMPQMKLLVQAAAQADIRGKTKILLSGGPVTEWFCKSIEADMYAPDPIKAAEMAAEYCRKVGGTALLR